MANRATDASGSKAQTFIVKVWPAEPTGGRRKATWRGSITHMPSGERRYIDELEEMVLFVAHYLNRMGM